MIDLSNCEITESQDKFNYLGIDLILPPNSNWVALSSDGGITPFVHKPEFLPNVMGCGYVACDDFCHCKSVDGYWEPRLEGNELQPEPIMYITPPKDFDFSASLLMVGGHDS